MLVTSGPTHEPIDPVRYIANRSSGKQGHAIAAAAARAGAAVTLVSGPVNLPDPPGVTVVHVETAREMLQAVERALPVDVAIFAAAVADWRVANAGEQKIKKKAGQATPELSLVENPDILSTIAHRKSQRPKLVIGFAAETENVAANAKAKLASKGCDWILANDVSPQTGIMGGDRNTIELVTATGDRALAAAIERRRGRHADRAHRGGAGAMSGASTSSIIRLPHGTDLPLPSYQSALAAGLDLIAAVPADAPLTPCARRARAGADRHRHRAAAGPRSAGAAALRPRRQARAHRAQRARHHRRRLPRRNPGAACESRQPKRWRFTRGMRIAQLVIATVARAQLREVDIARRNPARNRRIWLHRRLNGRNAFSARRMPDRSLLPLPFAATECHACRWYPARVFLPLPP